MRRPHRSIETFDISLMAVVTKAMGAFLVLMLLLLPYYTPNKLTEQDTQELIEQLLLVRDRIEEANRKLGQDKSGQGVQESLKEAKNEVELTAELVRKLRALLDKALADVARLENENRRLLSENEQLRGENEQLQGELKKAEDEIAFLNEEINKLKEEIERLENKLFTGDRTYTASVMSTACPGVYLDVAIMKMGSEKDYSWTKDNAPIKPEHILYINLSNGGEITQRLQKTAITFNNRQGPLEKIGYNTHSSIATHSSNATGSFILVVLTKERKTRYEFRGNKWRAITKTSAACPIFFNGAAKVAGNWRAMRPRKATIKADSTAAALVTFVNTKEDVTIRAPNKEERAWFDKLVALSLKVQRTQVKDLPVKPTTQPKKRIITPFSREGDKKKKSTP